VRGLRRPRRPSIAYPRGGSPDDLARWCCEAPAPKVDVRPQSSDMTHERDSWRRPLVLVLVAVLSTVALPWRLRLSENQSGGGAPIAAPGDPANGVKLPHARRAPISDPV